MLTPEQQEILGHMSILEIPSETDQEGNILSVATTIRFSGVNVQIVNGLGATNGNPVNPFDPTTNGLGNLIVGYNELNSRVLPICPGPSGICDNVNCRDPRPNVLCQGRPASRGTFRP